MITIPYNPPAKIRGHHLKNLQTKHDPLLIEALKEFAALETERYGVHISVATLMRDHLTKNTKDIAERHVEFVRFYRKKQEKHRVNQTTEQATAAEIETAYGSGLQPHVSRHVPSSS